MKNYLILICLCSFGKLQAQQAILQLSNDVQMTLNGDVHLILSNGALRNDGVFNAGTGSTVNFLGTNGEVSGMQPLAQTTFYHLLISVTDEVEVSRDIVVSSQLQFASGILLLGQAALTLDGLLVEEVDLSRIWSADNNSYVSTLESYNMPVSQNSGNIGLAISADVNIGQAELRRYHAPVTANGHTGIQRYFSFTPVSPGVYPGTLRFYYFDAELNAQAEQTLNLWHSPDGLNWTNEGLQLASTLDNYVEQTVADLSGYWTLADIDQPLPLNLIAFSATCTGEHVRVSWTTAHITGPMNFYLERSADGSQWTEIAKLSAQPEDEPTFVLEDNEPLAQGLYRIQISDQYGHERYSPVFPGGCEERLILSSLWPIPATDRLHLQLQATAAGVLTWRMLAVDGRLVQEGTQPFQQGSSVGHFDVSGIAAGSYVLHIYTSTEGEPQIFKFIKN